MTVEASQSANLAPRTSAHFAFVCYDGVLMKRNLTLLLVAPLALWSLSCKKAEGPTPAAATASPAAAPATGAPASAAVPAYAPPGVPGAPAAIKPMPPQIPDVLARVNSEKVERWEFDNAVKRMEARAGGPVPPDKRDEVLRGVLDQLVAYHLLAQESRARKLPIADSDVDARLADIRKTFPTEEAFKQGIAAQGLTLDQLKLQAKSSLEVAKVIDIEVNSKVAVTDAEVKAFYDQNLDRFKQGDSVHAAHILIGVPQNATAEQKAEAKAKAAVLLKTIKAGGDFATLAKANSQDPGSAPNGGDVGFFPKGQMTPAFEEAAFKLKPGTMSGVVETPFGFHIIKVIERRAPRTAPFDEVSGQIKDFLMQGQREQKLERFVEQVKAKGKIEMLV
jgi:peptidyl-prolyl cis-trans isomerase C